MPNPRGVQGRVQRVDPGVTLPGFEAHQHAQLRAVGLGKIHEPFYGSVFSSVTWGSTSYQLRRTAMRLDETVHKSCASVPANSDNKDVLAIKSAVLFTALDAGAPFTSASHWAHRLRSFITVKEIFICVF